MKNWKTTLMGATLAVLTAWSTISIEEQLTPKTIMMLIISGGIAALGYLYVDGKMNYTKQIDACNTEVVVLNEKIDKLTEHIRKSDSTLGYMISKVEMLQILK